MRLSFGTLGREYINQIEMIQYGVVRYIFNDYNLHRNRQADEPVWYQYDVTMTNIFAPLIKTPESWHTFLDLTTKIVICF